jgi:hypothetical protein
LVFLLSISASSGRVCAHSRDRPHALARPVFARVTERFLGDDKKRMRDPSTINNIHQQQKLWLQRGSRQSKIPGGREATAAPSATTRKISHKQITPRNREFVVRPLCSFRPLDLPPGSSRTGPPHRNIRKQEWLLASAFLSTRCPRGHDVCSHQTSSLIISLLERMDWMDKTTSSRMLWKISRSASEYSKQNGF